MHTGHAQVYSCFDFLWLYPIIYPSPEPPTGPVDITSEYELPPGEIGELIVSGWHVNTYQVDPDRLLTDSDGLVWLRIEDAGYMDSNGRIWLVGRVSWRVERDGETYWSVPVEQKVGYVT